MSDHNITYLTDISLLTCVVQSGFSEVIFKAALGCRRHCRRHQSSRPGCRGA